MALVSGLRHLGAEAAPSRGWPAWRSLPPRSGFQRPVPGNYGARPWFSGPGGPPHHLPHSRQVSSEPTEPPSPPPSKPPSPTPPNGDAKALFQSAISQLDLFDSDSDNWSEEGGPWNLTESLDESSAPAEPAAGAAAGFTKANYEVLRLDASGKVRRLFVKRRDLLREYRLQPRDLRRIDPATDATKTLPSLTVKENVLVLSLLGIRAIVTGEKALLFDPASPMTKRLLEVVAPRLAGGAELGAPWRAGRDALRSVDAGDSADGGSPFELEMLEGALMTAVGRLDAEALQVTARVKSLLTKLPQHITPVNLEELRRVKQALVELENRADMVRNTLEELMDDEEELQEFNLSSRPLREERRKQRERERLERELERAQQMKEEIEERRQLESDLAAESVDGDSTPLVSLSGTLASSSLSAAGAPGALPLQSPASASAATVAGASVSATPAPAAGASTSAEARPKVPLSGAWPFASALAAPAATPGNGANANGANGALGNGASSTVGNGAANGASTSALAPSPLAAAADSATKPSKAERRGRLAELRAKFSERIELRTKMIERERDGGRERDSKRDRDRDRDRGDRERDDIVEVDWLSRLESPEDQIEEAQDALEELADEEEEERELEEIEDLLEYYLQRSAATQSEAERLLAGARDLEESIGVSLSARRYEVIRLELTLSIGSFAAAVGAMVAGIFGMNMRSALEPSVAAFWAVTAAIVLGAAWLYMAIMNYTRRRRIL